MEVHNEHHLSVEITLGCGCVFEQRIAGQDVVKMAEQRSEELEIDFDQLDFEFPSGHSNLFGMIESIYNPALLMLIFSEGHVDKGNESIDIRVRTKVGELPTPEDWRRKHEE